MLLLCCATLVPEDAVYDWVGYQIKTLEFNQLLADVKTRYSELFVEMVTGCLSFDPKKRPTLTDILGYLQTRKFVN